MHHAYIIFDKMILSDIIFHRKFKRAFYNLLKHKQ